MTFIAAIPYCTCCAERAASTPKPSEIVPRSIAVEMGYRIVLMERDTLSVCDGPV